MDSNVHNNKALLLAKLHHQTTPLLLPNIWEPMGALILEDIGYPAVATSSYAVAFMNGLHDGENIKFSTLIQQVKNITQLVNVPVTVDFEKGFADNNLQLKKNIEKLLKAGVAGINFEDSDKVSGKLLPIEIQVEKVKLIKETALACGVDLFINARTDAYISNDNFSEKEKLNQCIERGKAYKLAGAGCIFPIFITDKSAINEIVTSLQMPININVAPGMPSLKELQTIGVKRISFASSFQKLALKKMKDFALNIKNLGSLDEIFNNDINANYLNGLLDKNQ